jgi:hypothetical protein
VWCTRTGRASAFERQQGWIIKTMKHEPSPVQDEYAPVIYSQETVSYIEGKKFPAARLQSG